MKPNTVKLDLETYNRLRDSRRQQVASQPSQAANRELSAKCNALAALVQGLLIQAIHLAELQLAVSRVGNSALVLDLKKPSKSMAVTLIISTEGQIELVGGDAYLKSPGFPSVFKQDELPRLLRELQAWQSRLSRVSPPRKRKKSKP